METRVTKWVRCNNWCHVSLCGRYMISELNGKVIRYTASEFPINGWYSPVEFPELELAMISV